MKNKLMTKIFVVAAAFVATPDIAGPLSAEMRVDARVSRLQQFLSKKECPIEPLAADFIEAADRHGLDWRLLPGISFVESSGGKFYKRNNIFGWHNAEKRFPSVRQGIHSVAYFLAHGARYRDKDVDGILKTYNPRPEYAVRVKQVMSEIGPSPGSE